MGVDEYMPIFTAIMDLFKEVENLPQLLETLGKVTRRLFASLYAAVLDSIAGVLSIATTGPGAGLYGGLGIGFTICGLFPAFVPALFITGLGLIGLALGGWF